MTKPMSQEIHRVSEVARTRYYLGYMSVEPWVAATKRTVWDPVRVAVYRNVRNAIARTGVLS